MLLVWSGNLVCWSDTVGVWYVGVTVGVWYVGVTVGVWYVAGLE